MAGHVRTFLLSTAILAVYAHAQSEPGRCNSELVPAWTDAGLVCGAKRIADDGSCYASFRGVPYAKQPIGELRFKELEPLEPWEHPYNAIEEGPICFQTDVFYGKIMQPKGMGEDCIRANIHVPIEALPSTVAVPAQELTPPIVAIINKDLGVDPLYETTLKPKGRKGLPILVFIHGGGFAFGSGDSDLHGPEYLVSKNVIVITFNYRLNVFGFLSLGTKEVPGNAGLRDIVTLLRWVKRNAANFGGDPDNVTLGGQSAGAIAAHLLTLSKAAEGLFQRTIIMSGTAISSFFSISPHFAKFIQSQLLAVLSINATDPDEIYKQLVSLPAEKLHEANNYLIEKIGLTTFTPTVETSFPGVTTIVDDYPEVLIASKRGKDIPLLVGYTNKECETFRKRLVKIDIVQMIKDNIVVIVPPKTIFTTSPAILPDVAKKIENRYYSDNITVDGFIHACTDGFYEYPVLKLAETRSKGEPMYVYRFSYNSDNGVFKKVDNLSYHGAGHVDDLTYVFKVNSVLGSTSSNPKPIRPQAKNNDDYMKDYMTNIFVSFINCGKPYSEDYNCNQLWPAATNERFLYEDIDVPYVDTIKGISSKQQDILQFFDSLTLVE